MKLNHKFSEMLQPGEYITITFVLGEGYGETAGRIMPINLHPGKRHPTLLDLKWSDGNRENHSKRYLARVELAEPLVKAGCFLLKDKYMEEGFAEGWEAFEKWQRGTRPRKDPSTGRKIAPSKGRAFPDRLLPKAVLALRENAKKVVAMAEVDLTLVHPADKKKAEDRAKVESEKTRLKADIEAKSRKKTGA